MGAIGSAIPGWGWLTGQFSTRMGPRSGDQVREWALIGPDVGYADRA